MDVKPAAERPEPPVAVGDYCRAVETYLCRKNDGHLIRIVGPSFERVCGWAERGIPLNAAYRGIDRCVERYYRKGPRRRPVHIDFCEADVLDVFDEWRKAVGVSSKPPEDADTAAEPGAGPGRRESLPAHLERAIARRTALRAGGDRSIDEVLGETTRELDGARVAAKGLRGEARAAFLTRLRDLDATLLAAARGRMDVAELRDLRDEAAAELAPFRARMAADAYERSLSACTDRLIRERARLPVLSLD